MSLARSKSMHRSATGKRGGNAASGAPLEALQRVVKVASEKTSAIELKAADAFGQVKNLVSSSNDQNTRLQKCQESVRELTAELAEARKTGAETGTLRTDLDAARSALALATKEAEATKIQLEAARNDLGKCNDEKEKLNLDAKRIATEFQSKNATSERELVELKSKIDTINTQADAVLETLTSLIQLATEAAATAVTAGQDYAEEFSRYGGHGQGRPRGRCACRTSQFYDI